jgi:hypothetical protein
MGRHLERQTLEAYCEERGRPKPRFWFGGRVEAPQCEAPQCETPQRDATRPSKPAAGEPQAGSPQSGEKPPSVGPARDPDLESFARSGSGVLSDPDRRHERKTQGAGFRILQPRAGVCG